MKHNEKSQKISEIIEMIQALHDAETPQSALDRFEDAVCELQQSIDELDKDADEAQKKAH
jgi:hypothetical protein